MNDPLSPDGIPLLGSCALCNLCVGAGHQAPPAMFAGKFDAPILVIGQNPGEMRGDDTKGLWWADKLSFVRTHYPKADTVLGLMVKNWYDWDFGLSHGNDMLEKLFGFGWLESGKYCFTNAVRCRTPGNAAPSPEMIANCAAWTRMLLINRRATILMGRVALDQTLGEEAGKLGWGMPRKHPRHGVMMAIQHYSTWKGDMTSEYRAAVVRIQKEIGLDVEPDEI